MELDTLLTQFTERNASDLHLAVGVPPIFRVNGALAPGDNPNLTPEVIDALLQSALPEEKLTAARQGLDFSQTLQSGQEVYHCQIFQERGHLAAAFRRVPRRIPTLEELQLPPILETLTGTARSGLFLVVGPVGSGKPTTLMAMLDQINMTRSEHIITLEDTRSYVFPSKLSLVNQRIVGEDTVSYEHGLMSAEKADPDVIFIGRLGTPQVALGALELAQTGHLVFSHMTTQTVSETISHLTALLPKPRRLAREGLGQCLQAIIAQKLLPAEAEYRDKTGRGRVAVNEILITTPRVQEMIIAGQTDMTLLMEASPQNGMQTMDNALRNYYAGGVISRETMENHLTKP
jgi:twitching motility protein PilT